MYGIASLVCSGDRRRTVELENAVLRPKIDQPLDGALIAIPELMDVLKVLIDDLLGIECLGLRHDYLLVV